MNGEAYFLAINGQQTGPFSTAQVQDMWRAGMISEQTLFWCKGAPSWQPLGNMVPTQEAPMPPGVYPASTTAPPGYYPAGVAPHYYAVPTTSTLAIISFALALSGFLFLVTWLPAIVLGHIALVQIRQSGGRLIGRGYAMAGLGISYGVILLGVLLFGSLFLFMPIDYSSEARKATVQEATPDPEVAASHDLSRARTLSMAIVAYSKDHDGMTPPDLAALFPKYVQDRTVLGEDEPGGSGTSFDYLSPNQKFDELDADKALLLGKSRSVNHRKVRISNDDRAGFEGADFHDPKPAATPSQAAEALRQLQNEGTN